MPALRDHIRPAIRLHPRPVAEPQGADASKAGGLFLWPAAEPWPVCQERGPAREDDEVHNEPLEPLLQLVRDDVPEFPFPEGSDVFQLLWCPWVHEG